MPTPTPAPKKFASSRGCCRSESMPARASTSRAPVGLPTGSSSRPLTESGPMLASRRVTAWPDRQTWRRVAGGSTQGYGADMGVQPDGAQLRELTARAQTATTLSRRWGAMAQPGIQTPERDAGTLGRARLLAVTWAGCANDCREGAVEKLEPCTPLARTR